MASELLEHYLSDRTRRAAPPAGSVSGAAGGAPCGDLVRLSLRAPAGVVEAASWDAEGCGAAAAAAAAVAERVERGTVLDAARVGTAEVSRLVGGLSPGKLHAAELAADALHRALSALVASEAPLVPPGERDRDGALAALSGGVDSAVAALLEREAGTKVVAVTLKLWADRRTDGERSCCSPEAVVGARALAHGMGLPHLTMDLEGEFRATVVDDFLSGYAAGRTPNPCVRCNGEVRIDAMVELAERAGASRLVTGHYARIEDDGDGPLLARPADEAKDQTYMLSAVRPETLARLRFPLAGHTKSEVREIAAQAGLPVASKVESQDLCFLAGEGKRSFLERHAGLHERSGRVIDRSGRSLGKHRGHHNFTVGQRRGLGIAAEQPLYVLATDPAGNTVTVGPRDELETTGVRVERATLHREGGRVDRVRLRYRSRPVGCSLRSDDGPAGAGPHASLELALDESVGGVAPGQTACLMDGDVVVGWGTIAG